MDSLVSLSEVKPVSYELVYRRFALKMIYEVSFFVASDGKLRLSNGDIFARGCERSTDQPKDENLFRFLNYGWPKPAQGGQEAKRPNGEIRKRIFIDDLFLCPDCGSFHLKDGTPELDIDESEKDWNSFKAKVESRTNVKEFYFKRCENHERCEFFKHIGRKEFTSWNRRRKKTEVPKAISIPEVEIKDEEPVESKIFVYVIEANSFYKIGIATSVAKRLAALQTSSPFVLKLVKSWESAFAQKAEKYLHKHFKDHRQKGEWFRLPSEQVETLLNISNLDEFISAKLGTS